MNGGGGFAGAGMGGNGGMGMGQAGMFGAANPMAQQMRPVAELFRIPFGDGETGNPSHPLLRRFHDTAVAPYRQAMSAFLHRLDGVPM